MSSLEKQAKYYNISFATARVIIIKWAKICNIGAQSFGLYPSQSEYDKLCPEDWQKRYPNTRCHLWDTTDVKLSQKPRESKKQVLTYSDYYNGMISYLSEVKDCKNTKKKVSFIV